MKFLVILGKEYGGEGAVAPAFVIEADDVDSVPSAVLPIDGGDLRDVEVAEGYLDAYPEITAAGLAQLSGPQHSGILAREDDGMVVTDSSGELAEEDEFHWTELNIPEDSEDPLGDGEELQEEWENTRAAQREAATTK